jgi:hypothetical protein
MISVLKPLIHYFLVSLGTDRMVGLTNLNPRHTETHRHSYGELTSLLSRAGIRSWKQTNLEVTLIYTECAM